MSLDDFSQDARDHANLFVYVFSLGPTSGALFGAVMAALRDFPPIHPGGSRDALVFVRFLNQLPRWARDWSSWQGFQAHKQVLGVLAVTQCHDFEELEAATENFKKKCRDFDSGLCDSRCVVFGSSALLGETVSATKGFSLMEFDHQKSFTVGGVEIHGLETVVTDLVDSIYTRLQTHVATLKKGLEGGRLPATLRSPLDGKEGEGDEEMRLPRNQKIGRLHKNIADLHLLCGQLQQATSHFLKAINHLAKDFLWLAASNEGLGATFLIKSKCDELLRQKIAPLCVQSNALGGLLKRPTGISGTRLSLKNPDSRRKSSGDTMSTRADEKTASMNGRSSVYRRVKSPSPDSALDLEDANDSLEISHNDISDGEGAETEEEEEEEGGIANKKLLQKDLVIDRFTRAELYYTKAGPTGGVARIELLFKFAKYLVSERRNKEACDALQRVIGIEGFIDDSDKTTLYKSIACVFSMMGFHRKAAMFNHWAARQANSLAETLQEYYEAHKLLIKCLPGYKLLVDVTNATVPMEGWPVLQAEVMVDLVSLSHHTEQSRAAVQYSSFLLQAFHSYLDKKELSTVITALEEVTQNHNPHEFSPVHHHPLNLLEEDLISVLPLTELPQVCYLRPKELPLHLMPRKTEGHSSNSTTPSGPFIYTPISARAKKGRQQEIIWVNKDPSEVTLEVTNVLPSELRVEGMRVLWEGVSLESCPSSLTLPSSERHQFALIALPQEVGKLEILGYEHTVFGVRSKCTTKKPGDPCVRVIPELPELRVHLVPLIRVSKATNEGRSPGRDMFKRADSCRKSVGPKIFLDLIDGEMCKVEFKLECIKKLEISQLSVSVSSESEQKPEDYCLFSCASNEEIVKLLPLVNKELKSFVATVTTKFPSYFRVKNKVMTRLPSSKRNSLAMLQEIDGFQKQSLKSKSGQTSPLSKRFSNERGSPPISHITRQNMGSLPRKKAGIFLTKRGQSIAPSNSAAISIDSGFNSPDLMNSLNLEVSTSLPFLSSSSSSSLPSPLSFHRANFGGSPKPLTKRGSRWKDYVHRTVGTDGDEWDFDQYDKRASIRSDPGEMKRDVAGTVGSHSPKSSILGSPVHKSPNKATTPLSTPGSPDSVLGSVTGVTGLQNLRDGIPRHHAGMSVLPKAPTRVSRRGAGGGITKANISAPSAPLHKKPNIPLKGVTVKGLFKFQYSGGDGEKAGYHRQLEAKVEVKVRPCLYFDEFQVSSVNGNPDIFAFSFDAYNISDFNLQVTCSSKQGDEGIPHLQRVAVLCGQRKRVEMMLRRFTLKEAHLQNELHLTKLYSDRLARMVTVQWQMEGCQRSGVGNLEGLRLPNSALTLLQPVPLVIDLCINRAHFTSGGVTSSEVTTGTPLELIITVRNNTDYPVPSFVLLADLYEFDKQVNRQLTGKVVHSGNMEEILPPLEKGGSVQHRLSLVFLYKGCYQMTFKAFVFESGMGVGGASGGVGVALGGVGVTSGGVGGASGGVGGASNSSKTGNEGEAGGGGGRGGENGGDGQSVSKSDGNIPGRGKFHPTARPLKSRAQPIFPPVPHPPGDKLESIPEDDCIATGNGTKPASPQKVKMRRKGSKQTVLRQAAQSANTVVGPSLSINVIDDHSIL